MGVGSGRNGPFFALYRPRLSDEYGHSDGWQDAMKFKEKCLNELAKSAGQSAAWISAGFILFVLFHWSDMLDVQLAFLRDVGKAICHGG